MRDASGDPAVGAQQLPHGAHGAHETPLVRGRRKFVAGALEQAAHILGATAASVLVAGLVAPYIAAFAGGASQMPPQTFGAVSAIALCVSLMTALAAIVLRGLSRRANDDGSVLLRPPQRPQ